MRKPIKKMKGFTLIELLAVIVVLAIIALIAVPLILNMIEESRIKSAVISGGNYVKAVNYKIAQEEMKGNPIVLDEEDNTYVIGENELEIDAENIENITGEYILDTVGVTWAGLCVNKYPVVYYDGKASYDKGADYCGGESYHFVEPNGELVSAICESADGASIYTNNTEFKIKTLEDLACLSETVNGGRNFNGKKIYLVNDIDLSSTSSYRSSATKKYGDINGDNVVEGLKEEDFFKRVDLKREKESDFFVEDKDKKARVTSERTKLQNEVDTQVKKAVEEVPMMKEYLKNRFALKDGDKPHLMKF